MFSEYFADLHIHIGAASSGNPVKITASRSLTFANILKESAENKGLDIIGIIDCASPPVIADIEKLLAEGLMEELKDGGIKYGNLTVIMGAEIESRESNGGQSHYLAYFPFLRNIKDFSEIMSEYIKNITLSSQSTGLNASQLLQIIDSTGGVCIPAHVFTPYKSFYGRSFSSYQEVFTTQEWEMIPAIELGLSADTYLADYLPELRDKTFISNSDAHSLPKIAREYNKIRLKELSFKELILALKNSKGRKVLANYGLDPRLGKYHHSYCEDCEQGIDEKGSILKCPLCGGDKVVKGVKDRIMEISVTGVTDSPVFRPAYIHQIPLLDIPGIGPRTMEKLLIKFATEMDILHKVSFEDLRLVVGDKIASSIVRARSGAARIKTGGGGFYGKVMG
ncbi:MAG: TIGR00375 family protein [Firmicutes bacterium]|nr:TIGR00375 family protein [Bacillota bacterium]